VWPIFAAPFSGSHKNVADTASAADVSEFRNAKFVEGYVSGPWKSKRHYLDLREPSDSTLLGF
jgi:hypothetical protein